MFMTHPGDEYTDRKVHLNVDDKVHLQNPKQMMGVSLKGKAF
jgi:hypothetical protein